MATESKRIEEFKKLMEKYVTAELIDKLIKTGFFIKPASINHHGNYDGALFYHSKAVTETLVSFTEKLGLQWQKERSPYIVGMFHDLCKVDDYAKDTIGQWGYNKNSLLTGHGAKSVIMLQQYLTLTEEELLCIRWHMGAFDIKDNWNKYDKACEKYPNVLYTHTADMVASQVMHI